jgi:hypothetical protein
MVGGNYNNTAGNVGLFNFNANNSSSNANSNVGARLLVYFFHCAGFSSPLGENIAGRTGFSRLVLEEPCRQTRSA